MYVGFLTHFPPPLLSCDVTSWPDSSSRIFAGGNEDGEVFAFVLNGLSSGTFLDPVVKFPTDLAGAPVTAMSIADLDHAADASDARWVL